MSRTHTHSYDYDRQPGARTPLEDAIIDHVTELVSYLDRGLLTLDEFTRLVAAGPGWNPGHAAILPASQAHAELALTAEVENW